MRVLLKLVLDCHPDDAWWAIRSPAVLREASYPLVTFESLELEGFPSLWEAGEHPVLVRGLGMIPIGEQVIGISYPARSDGVRVMRDTGRALSGPLTAVTKWEHSLTVAPAPGGRTLYRDQLKYSAGPLSALLWPVYWAMWQWRAFGLKRLAPEWGAAAR
jgi:hypothetical protein